MTVPQKPVLLTGASGNLGRMLTAALSEQGFRLRLTDIKPFPDPLPEGVEFTTADLGDSVAMHHLADGCGAILHFGGVSIDRPFEEVLDPNIRGLYHIYECARRQEARVLFASSNHAIGFHERPGPGEPKLDYDCPLRPDSFYGLSKVYGEMVGRLYWDKHGVENLNVRIGSSFPEPVDVRMLSTWLSFADLARLCAAFLTAEKIGHAVVWGASNNAATFWGGDHRDRIGWQPQDTADVFAGQLAGKLSDNPVTERYQGGAYTATDYSRAKPSPKDLFGLD